MRNLKRMSMDDLVTAYEEATSAHGRARETGDARRGNQAADAVAAIYRELRRRGSAAQRALLPLLSSTDLGTRGWAAAHALDFAPQDGEPVLEALAAGDGIGAFSAEMTLRVWREGRLRFP